MKSRFVLTIDLGNDAMRTAEDIADALKHVRFAVLVGKEAGPVMDANGNKVGTFAIEEN